MARMGLRATINAYHAEDTMGNKIGMRAFAQMSMEDLYDTTKNIVKYENKRIRSMIDKGYATQAIYAYARQTGRLDVEEAAEIRRTQGRDAYLAYIRKNATIYMGNREQYVTATDPEAIEKYRRDLMNRLNAAVRFDAMKTSKIKGEKQARKKAEATINREYGLNLRRWNEEEKNQFWDLLHDLTTIGTEFSAAYNLGSDVIISDIGDLLRSGEYETPEQALLDLNRRYNDLSAEGLNNANEFFDDRPRRLDGFDDVAEIERMTQSGDIYRNNPDYRELEW